MENEDASPVGVETNAPGNLLSVAFDTEKLGEPEGKPEKATSSKALTGPDGQPLSKNAFKRLKRKQEFELKRADIKRRKKEKKKAQKARRREQLQAEMAAAEAQGLDRSEVLAKFQQRSPMPGVSLPIALVLDCDFESCMTEREQTSLSSQLMRLVGINRRSPYRFSGLYFGGWKGSLRHRFETVLGGNHLRWKGARFLEEDFVAAAQMAKKDLTAAAAADAEAPGANEGGSSKKKVVTLPPFLFDPPPLDGRDSVADLPETTDSRPSASQETSDPPAPQQQRKQQSEVEEDSDPSIIYLTSDSPNTIVRLRPNTAYVVGALVDKNREKGLCYRRAREKGIATGRLPISEYMDLRARHVLTTNQVAEILLRWMQCGDWATAFLEVIPPRKGGKLREEEDGKGDGAEEVEADENGDGSEDHDADDGEDGDEMHSVDEDASSESDLERGGGD